ncbi:MAG: ABC transporter permease subunit, partial [Rhodobacterales bacterium]|nr:ABC transporter permease subunit [Rhodobacterales bacterium]
MRRSFFPIIVVISGLLAIWYAAVVPMNIKMALTAAERSGIAVAPVGAKERRDRSAMLLVVQNTFAVKETFALERPRLPAPHQVAAELWNSTVNKKITSKRSLVFHGWITLSSTLLGFAIGTGLGILLAIGIVYNRAMDMSVMPWAIASQTIPILAIAPMIIVVFNSVGLQGIFPKAIISAYLSFFPVVVGMVKGLRSP